MIMIINIIIIINIIVIIIIVLNICKIFCVLFNDSFFFNLFNCDLGIIKFLKGILSSTLVFWVILSHDVEETS